MSDYDEDELDFIQCVDGRETHIHKVWNFGEDGVTCDIHLTARADVGTGLVGEFATNYLTPSWRRIPIFRLKYINGSVHWLALARRKNVQGQNLICSSHCHSYKVKV